MLKHIGTLPVQQEVINMGVADTGKKWFSIVAVIFVAFIVLMIALGETTTAANAIRSTGEAIWGFIQNALETIQKTSDG